MGKLLCKIGLCFLFCSGSLLAQEGGGVLFPIEGKAEEQPPVKYPDDLSWTKRCVPGYIVFVLDVSGSMNCDRYDFVKVAMRNCLATLNPTWKFNIITFADSTEVFVDGTWLNLSPEQIEKAHNWIASRRIQGYTNIDLSFDLVAPIQPDKGVPFLVVVMSDFVINGSIHEWNRVLDKIDNCLPREKELFLMSVTTARWQKNFILDFVKRRQARYGFILGRKDQ